MNEINWLLTPLKLYTRDEVLARPSLVPKKSGVYAWYFRAIPPIVPLEGEHWFDGYPLLADVWETICH